MIYSGLVDHLKKLAGITQKEEKSSDDDDSTSDERSREKSKKRIKRRRSIVGLREDVKCKYIYHLGKALSFILNFKTK